MFAFTVLYDDKFFNSLNALENMSYILNKILIIRHFVVKFLEP